MNKFAILLSGFLCLAGAVSGQSLEQTTEQRLKDFFTSYETSYARIGKCKLERFEVEHEKKLLRVYANPAFGYQPFTEENVSAIYRMLKQSLPCRCMPMASSLKTWCPMRIARNRTRRVCMASWRRREIRG